MFLTRPVQVATPFLLILAAAALPAVGRTSEPDPPSAAAAFERILAAEGLDAACDSLAAMIADTTGLYEIDGYRLVKGLPTELTLAGRRDAALALIRAVEPRFGDHPLYWSELAGAYLRDQKVEEARASLLKSQELDPSNPQHPWMLANLESLAKTIAAQIAAEGRFTPGENTGLQGPYLGQSPPGGEPEVFAPGLLSTLGHEYSISFSPDGRTIIFSRSGVGTLICRWEETGWTAPEVLHLRGEDFLDEEAAFAADGERIFFCSRPRDLSAEREIHVAARTSGGWGEPRHLFQGMYPTCSADGVLYYTGIGERPDYGVIVRRLPVGDGFGEPEPVPGEGINTPAPDAHPWIAPDGGLLLFDSYRDPGAGLFVSFREPDGGWGEAVGLGDRLGIPPAGQPALSHDGRYLFFCLAGDMYWVDAGFLAGLAPAREQEAADDFTPRVEHPAFKPGTGPEVRIDEAHHNFHTRDGRYRAFGDLLEADGFQVAASVQPFTSGSLEGCAILVISNALSGQDAEDWALPSESAFTPEEIAEVRDWVDRGGSLWLIVDHMPMPGCNNELAASFGIAFSNGYARVPGHRGALVFTGEDGGLADHPLTRGARAGEKIGIVASFTGSAFRAGPGFEPLLVLPPDTESWLTVAAGDFTDDTPREDVGGWLQGGVQVVGRGRIAVFGEAAMFTAQVARDGETEVRFGFIAPEARDNQQFLLNVARWLAAGHAFRAGNEAGGE